LLKKVAKEAGDMRNPAQGTEWKGENATVTKAFVVRVCDEFLGRAAEADSTCSWGLRQLTKNKHEFGTTYYGSLKDAKTDARMELQNKADSEDYTPPAKWGSGTIKPDAEFLSYRSWMDGGEALLHGDINGAIQG
jgi:hypothetical protein